jgi:hypothetical protein
MDLVTSTCPSSIVIHYLPETTLFFPHICGKSRHEQWVLSPNLFTGTIVVLHSGSIPNQGRSWRMEQWIKAQLLFRDYLILSNFLKSCLRINEENFNCYLCYITITFFLMYCSYFWGFFLLFWFFFHISLSI